jgi:hypothetical protein
MYISLQCLQQCAPDTMPFKFNMSCTKIKYYSKYFPLVNIFDLVCLPKFCECRSLLGGNEFKHFYILCRNLDNSLGI